MASGGDATLSPSQRVARRELQTDIIRELERAGVPTAAIHYVMAVLLPHGELRYAQIAQRVRWAKEKRARTARQKAEKPRLRQRAITAFSATCAYCDRRGSPEADPDGKPWELDRILPGAFGGEYDPANVALACHACNQRKGRNVTFCPPPSLAKLEAA